MAPSRLLSSTRAGQHTHAEHVSIPISSPQIYASHPVDRNIFSIKRKSIGVGCSSLAADERLGKSTTPGQPVAEYPSVAGDGRDDEFAILRKPAEGYSSVTLDGSGEQVGEREVGSSTLNHQPLPAWRPFYLQKRVVTSFALLSISLLVAVEVLYQLSQRWHGLVSLEQRLKYLWTYGPIFAIVAAFWSRLEYQAKQSAPWSALVKGSSEASKSVLLDYISPLKPTALLAAIRNKHYLTSCGILGSLIFKLIIIFSTGLMSLTRVMITRNNMNMDTLDTFVGNRTALKEIGSLPWDILTGINYKNLSFPLGTNEQFSVQTFNVTGVSESVIEATVDGFNTYLSCEQADVVTEYWYLKLAFDKGHYNYASGWPANQTIKTPSCTISNATFHLVDATVKDFNSTQYWVVFQAKSCDGIGIFGNKGRRVLVSAGRALVGHKVVTVIPEKVNGVIGPGWPDDTVWANGTVETANVTIIDSTTLLCQPVYSISKVIATINSSDTTSKSQLRAILAPSSKNWTLGGVDAWDIFDAQTIAGSQSRYTAATLLITPYHNSSINIDKEMIQGLALYGDSSPNLEDLFKADVLGGVANRYFSTIGAQIASASLLKEQIASLTGLIVVYENRVFVGALATRAIEAGLAAILVLSLAIVLLISKRGLATRDPSSIFGLAIILRHSPSLVALLHRTGALSIQDLHTKLDGYVFNISLRTRPSFDINVEHYSLTENLQNGSPKDSIDDKLPAWEPFFITLLGRALLCVITVAVIVALEVLLYVSQHHTGFGNAPTGGYLHYVWRYIPVILMVILGWLFTAVDFSTQCLAPYSELKTYTTFEISLAVNFLDRLPLVAIFESIRNGHWAVAATTVAVILGSILTIAGGGVYTVEAVPRAWPIHLLQQSYFTSNDDEITTNTETYGISVEGLILYGNMSEPDWTYDDLALTRLGFSSQDQMPINGNPALRSKYINVMIPALRSKLSCRVSKSSDLNITLKLGASVLDNNGDPFQNPLIITSDYENCGKCPCEYFGYQTPFHWSVEPYTYFGMATDNPGGGRGPTCSNFAFVWGKLDANSIQHIGYLSCNETAEAVAVNTTLLYPSLALDPDHPPKPDESTATPSSAILPSLEYVYNYLPNVTFGGTDNNLDTFWSGAIFGLNGIPLSYLNNSANDQDVIDRITHLHKLIRAQQLNNYTRIITNNASRVGTPLSANITNPNQLRVVQDATSTRILEGLLATMVLCVVVSGMLMDTRGTVTKNPCSIAAVGSFLADSNLMDILPESQKVEEIVDSKEVARRLRLLDKSVVFQMGWTGEEENRRVGNERAVYGIQMVRLGGEKSKEALATPEAEAESMLS